MMLVNVYACTCECTTVYLLCVFIVSFHLRFWEWVSHWTWSWLIWLDCWPGSPRNHPVSICSLALGLRASSAVPSSFRGFWRPELRCSCSLGRHCTELSSKLQVQVLKIKIASVVRARKWCGLKARTSQAGIISGVFGSWSGAHQLIYSSWAVSPGILLTLFPVLELQVQGIFTARVWTPFSYWAIPGNRESSGRP